MTDEEKLRRVAQAEWIKRAAEVAETLTDDEILSLGRRLRSTTSSWLRNVASLYPLGTVELDNLEPVAWVMRLLLEERGYTLQGIQLGPRSRDETNDTNDTVG